jgi:thymidine phosphorylase
MDSSDRSKLRRLGIDTRNEHTVYMRKDCPVCASEGFEALTRIRVSKGDRSIVASLNVLEGGGLLERDEVSLSEEAVKVLGAEEGDLLTMSPLPPIDSMSLVRKKIYGHRLDGKELHRIVEDMVEGNYSNVQISGFVTACAGHRMDRDEIVDLTRAMVDVGQSLTWSRERIYDKHSVGGLPGNRTTPIVVAIVAAYGLPIPKTSSRAITSPAGTADAMETITRVDLSLERMKELVEEQNGCLAWGGSVMLSPADDIMIRVERALDLDSEGQLIASVLSKKAAAGSTHVVIDVPIGPTAKVRDRASGKKLAKKMKKVASAIGIELEVLLTDGSGPVGRGIGPALEARDLLAVLRNEDEAPADLKERALELAAPLLELSGELQAGEGLSVARELLRSGKALERFEGICRAQGTFREPVLGERQRTIPAEEGGKVQEIDNRKLAKLARLAGAPDDPGAGLILHVPIGGRVKEGDPMLTLYAETEGELEYAMSYYRKHLPIVGIG